MDSPKEFIENNKLISKIQQRFKTERHNVFTEEINKIALRIGQKFLAIHTEYQ